MARKNADEHMVVAGLYRGKPRGFNNIHEGGVSLKLIIKL